jgi:hypothetical protein
LTWVDKRIIEKSGACSPTAANVWPGPRKRQAVPEGKPTSARRSKIASADPWISATPNPSLSDRSSVSSVASKAAGGSVDEVDEVPFFQAVSRIAFGRRSPRPRLRSPIFTHVDG